MEILSVFPMMTCPACASRLVSRDFKAYVVHACEQCHGLWLDKDDLLKLGQAAGSENASDASLLRPSMTIMQTGLTHCPRCANQPSTSSARSCHRRPLHPLRRDLDGCRRNREFLEMKSAGNPFPHPIELTLDALTETVLFELFGDLF